MARSKKRRGSKGVHRSGRPGGSSGRVTPKGTRPPSPDRPHLSLVPDHRPPFADDLDPDEHRPTSPARALEKLAGGLRSCPTATEAALWASQFVASARQSLEVAPMASRAQRDAAERELEQMLLSLVDIAAESTSPTALCLLAALCDSTPPVVRTAAGGARDDKLRRRVPGPDWVAHSGKVELLGAHQWIDPFGDGQSVILQFAYPDGDEHCLHAYIDHNMSGVLKQLFVSGPMHEVLDATARAPEPMELRPLDPAEAAGWLRSGAWVLDHMPGAPVDDEVPETRALLEARLTQLPDREHPTRPEADPDEIETLVRTFLDAPEAAEVVEELGAIEVEAVADLVATHATNHCGGVPDRVSPTTMELFLVDFLPRKVMGAEDLAGALRPVLPAWARWCGRRRGLEDRLIAGVVASIELFVPRFVDIIGSGPDRGGRAGTALRVLSWAQEQGLIGDDTEDLAAMQAAMSVALSRFNELSFEERGAILGLEDGLGSPFEHDWDDDGSGVPQFPWPDRTLVGAGIVLPPLPATGSGEALASAAGAPVLADFGALRRYFGEGRALTSKGNVKVADTLELIEMLDTGDPTQWRSGDKHMQLRSVEDAPVLSRRLALARACGALGPAGRTGRSLGAGEVWREPSDQQALEALTEIVDTALESGLYTLGFRLDGNLMHERFTDRMNAVAPMMLIALAGSTAAGTAADADDLTALLVELDDDAPWKGDSASPWVRESTQRDLERLLANLEWLGIGTWTGSEVVPDRWTAQPRRRGGRVVLTPAGVEALRRVLPTFGITFDAGAPH